MSDTEQNVKPDVQDDQQLNIKVKDADGFEVFFKVKKTTKLSKLKKAYAERMGKPVQSVRFMFDGSRVGDDDTAEALGLEDQDELDAMIEQLGGASVQGL